MRVSPLRQKAFPLGEGVGITDERGLYGINKFLLNLGEMPLPRLIVIPIRSKRWKVSPLGGVKRF